MKKYQKMAVSVWMSLLIMTPVFSVEAASFSDVSDRYKESVGYMVDHGISAGINANQFGVSLSMKRVDAAVMLAKALELNLEAAPKSSFTDVPARAQKAVSALKAAGIVSGKTATVFGSDQVLTRGEMAIILVRAYKLQGAANHSFSDVSSRYDAAVQALVANKVTSGKSVVSFGTADSIKRGEFALFLYRTDSKEQMEGNFEVIDIY
ncbi:S-layer homology domain-containing protein [Domibacillus mangrovi]|uniref:SLH domain-containing protein n=1 Tax=Domibacillus mangrovi TaxID=1714354 RepID=A0A1Q5P5U3_9BACI|nr:S-layer homology domain-containing protein [Domibacillus mangrovi]OKL37640.1 hypothetical protein BLL40_04895 [Domibacillus mangrovi]